MSQTPDPIPCGTTGSVSSNGTESVESLHYGTSMQAGTLYDEAIDQAFNRAWHGAQKCKCGEGCFPLVVSVNVHVVDVDYSYQNVVSALYWKAQFSCVITFSWTAKVSCTTVPPSPSIMLPAFAKGFE